MLNITNGVCCTFKGYLIAVFTCFYLLASPYVSAHGGVAFEEDQCVLTIGFLKAHFTGYQPQSEGSAEFCEDIPNIDESVFVIDYLHDFLKEMAVDFRIIKDVTQFGKYAKWQDIESLSPQQIEDATVFYEPPVVRPDGIFKANYRFRDKGDYIGIVTARHHSKDKFYHAVFYFQVGGNNYGYLPFFVVVVLLAQGLYWFGKRRNNQPTKSKSQVSA